MLWLRLLSLVCTLTFVTILTHSTILIVVAQPDNRRFKQYWFVLGSLGCLAIVSYVFDWIVTDVGLAVVTGASFLNVRKS